MNKMLKIFDFNRGTTLASFGFNKGIKELMEYDCPFSSKIMAPLFLITAG